MDGMLRQPNSNNKSISTCLGSRTGTRFNKSLANGFALVGIAIVLSLNTGCQTLHPFAQKTRAKIQSAQQWANTGLDAFQKGHLDKAKGFFSRATESDPNDYHNRANLARTLYQSGDRQNAILEMQQAADHSKGDPRLLIELGEMYLAAGQWLPARRQVDLALESNNRYAPAWALSGKTAKAKGDFQQALANFQRALGYEPDLPGVQLEIADTYQRMGESLRALAAVEQLLSKHPKEEQPNEAIIAKSIALMNLNQLSPAIDILQTLSLIHI